MATKKFTLLELHLGDGTVQIGPATVGGPPSASDDDAAEDEDAAEDDDEAAGGRCPGRTAGKLLLAVVALALVAALARKLFEGGDLEDLEELEELVDVDEE